MQTPSERRCCGYVEITITEKFTIHLVNIVFFLKGKSDWKARQSKKSNSLSHAQNCTDQLNQRCPHENILEYWVFGPDGYPTGKSLLRYANLAKQRSINP